MKKEKKQDRGFGLNTKDLLKKLNRDSSLSKMLEICSISDLQKSSKICATSGIMRNGKLYQRAPLAQNIYESESGSWPTPTCRDCGLPLPPRKKNPSGGQKPPLVSVVNGRLNPLFVEYLMGYPLGWSDIEGRESKLLVTQ